MRIQTSKGSGSGYIYDKAGFIITNAHVVGSDSVVTVVLADLIELSGQVIGRHEPLDLAVIKLAVSGPIPIATLRESDKVSVGDEVIAIGYPLGTLLRGEATVTRGIVSARRQGGDVSYIQTDASINPGNSGGPLLNSKGEVVGINTSKIEVVFGRPVQGIGLAIPISTVRQLRPFLAAGAVTVSATPAPTPLPTPNPTPVSRPTPTSTPPAIRVTYYNSVAGYSIRVPANWTINDTNKSGVIIKTPGPQLASINIFTFNAAGQTLDQYTDGLIDFRRLNAKVSYEFISRSRVTLASGLRAARIEYLAQTAPEYCIEHFIEVVVFVGSAGYLSGGSVCEYALEQYIADVEAVLNSFTLR